MQMPLLGRAVHNGPWQRGWVAVAANVVACALILQGAAARTWHVPGDATTIQAGINLAQAGDDVLVGPGTYPEHDIAMKAGVWVHSEDGPESTIVDSGGAGRAFDCEDQVQPTTIEGMGVRYGHSRGTDEQAGSGGGIRCVNSDLTIRDCIISHCSADMRGGGIFAWNSQLLVEQVQVEVCSANYEGGGVYGVGGSNRRIRITDSVIVENEAGTSDGGVFAAAVGVEVLRCIVARNVALWGGAGGIAVSQSAVTMLDCLIVDNAAYDSGVAGGLGIGEGNSGSVTGCTVANNFGEPPPGGIEVELGSTVQINNTIIAGNVGQGLSCYFEQTRVVVECCDIYGNTEGDQLCNEDAGGNFSSDPLFCNHDDYTLDGASPCLPGWIHGGIDCGLIGARSRGCGTAPTGACCFSDGSCSLLGSQQCADQHGAYQGNGTTCTPNPCQATPTRTTTWGHIKSTFH